MDFQDAPNIVQMSASSVEMLLKDFITLARCHTGHNKAGAALELQ
jgi:hypothetical protein